MQQTLSISLGQSSDKGRKAVNQDFHGALIPSGPALALKGISVVLTDGISSSKVSQIAAESMVKSFLTDYYSTSETWSVKTSAMRVIRAANSWMFAETQRSIHAQNMDHGYVCTLSALVLKGGLAHIFHVGDSRVYRLEGEGLEPLTTDHRTVVSSVQSYLARAIGMAATVDVDYRAVPMRPGDIFVLATDGVFEHIEAQAINRIIRAHPEDPDIAAKTILRQAYENGSADNLTVQIVRIDALPPGEAGDIQARSNTLPAPPLLEAGQLFEGYRILRPLHANHRSHIYLVEDIESQARAALKIPSTEMREDKAALARFMMEDWIARRINSAHVLKALPQARAHNYIYTLTEYIEGQTLTQWMTDNPDCDLETMRGIIEQIIKGLRAFHRKEMLHQDLRPENIMIDSAGTVKIIDFGSTRVAGVLEAGPVMQPMEILGTLQYTAPEYFLGEGGSRASDFFSLGVVAYQMLTGIQPYGAQVSKIRTRAQMRKLKYTSARRKNRQIPAWIDGALKKATHPDPEKRYRTLSEFADDLRRPNPRLLPKSTQPLAERDPVVFWRGLAVIFGFLALLLAVRLATG